MKIDKIFSGLNISSAGMSAQRKRMNAIASNVANADTTRTDEGGPYRRKVVSIRSDAAVQFSQVFSGSNVPLERTRAGHISFQDGLAGGSGSLSGEITTVEEEDQTPFKLIHDPSHPDADEDGYVKAPNVNIVAEMVEMMSASRAYEANVTVINAEKAMAKDSLEI